MGVSAIFVSTLAVTELPRPHSPPQNQAELLAATLQTIVAFVVLGSIIVRTCDCPEVVTYLLMAVLDGLSIPFFSVSRRIHSRTVTMTRTWTSRSSRTANVPDWLHGMRRMPSTKLGDQTTDHAAVMPGIYMAHDVESADTPSIILPFGSEQLKPVMLSGGPKHVGLFSSSITAY